MVLTIINTVVLVVVEGVIGFDSITFIFNIFYKIFINFRRDWQCRGRGRGAKEYYFSYFMPGY